MLNIRNIRKNQLKIQDREHQPVEKVDIIKPLRDKVQSFKSSSEFQKFNIKIKKAVSLLKIPNIVSICQQVEKRRKFVQNWQNGPSIKINRRFFLSLQNKSNNKRIAKSSEHCVLQGNKQYSGRMVRSKTCQCEPTHQISAKICQISLNVAEQQKRKWKQECFHHKNKILKVKSLKLNRHINNYNIGKQSEKQKNLNKIIIFRQKIPIQLNKQ